MRIIEILRKGSTLHLSFATIFIIPFQTYLLIPFSIESLNALQTHPLNLFQNNLILFIEFFSLPIIYCIIISLLFQPKRLVSPINIQIGSFALFSIFVINSYLDSTQKNYENLFIVMSLIAIYIMTIGFIQFFIVRWVIGLNYNDSDRRAFTINGSPKEIVHILGKNFKFSRNFKAEKKEGDNPIWIFTCFDNLRNTVIVAFGSFQNNKNKCVLAIVAYRKTMSWISKSQIATNMSVSIKNDIEYRLKEANKKYIIFPLKKVDDFVSSEAFCKIELETMTKFEVIIDFFRKIPTNFRRAIYITSFISIILTIALSFGKIDFNNYINVIVPVLIALIIEIGIPLKDVLKTKKIDEFD